MGMYCGVRQLDVNGQSIGEAASLEKSWHGLHYLLTGNAYEGEFPKGFLLAGGSQIGGEEGPRRFNAAEVQQIHAALDVITDTALWANFDAVAMSEEGIYPDIWDEDEEELREEYVTYFHDLKNILRTAAEHARAIEIEIG